MAKRKFYDSQSERLRAKKTALARLAGGVRSQAADLERVLTAEELLTLRDAARILEVCSGQYALQAREQAAREEERRLERERRERAELQEMAAREFSGMADKEVLGFCRDLIAYRHAARFGLYSGLSTALSAERPDLSRVKLEAAKLLREMDEWWKKPDPEFCRDGFAAFRVTLAEQRQLEELARAGKVVILRRHKVEG